MLLYMSRERGHVARMADTTEFLRTRYSLPPVFVPTIPLKEKKASTRLTFSPPIGFQRQSGGRSGGMGFPDGIGRGGCGVLHIAELQVHRGFGFAAQLQCRGGKHLFCSAGIGVICGTTEQKGVGGIPRLGIRWR